MHMSDAQGQLKLKLKKKNDVTMQRSDLKSPTARPERPSRPLGIEVELTGAAWPEERRPLGSAEALDVESRFLL